MFLVLIVLTSKALIVTSEVFMNKVERYFFVRPWHTILYVGIALVSATILAFLV